MSTSLADAIADIATPLPTTYQLHPKQFSANHIEVWIGVWSHERPTGNVKLVALKNGADVFTYSFGLGSLEKRGRPVVTAEGMIPPCWHKVLTFPQREPDTEYTFELRINNTVVAEAAASTLPMRLSENPKRPFTVFLGSCYYAPNDGAGEVGLAFQRLRVDPKYKYTRPTVKFLVGDQVYLDAPVQRWILGPGLSDRGREIRSAFTARYWYSWSKLDRMLSYDAAYHLADDHEFWNDFPRHNAPWMLGWIGGTYYTRKAREFYDAFQASPGTAEFSVGEDLSFFVADTRRHQSKNSERFMYETEFLQLLAWVRDLRSPGILVLSQPLFVKPTSDFVFGGAEPTNVTLPDMDHGLPWFKQYKRLAHALMEAGSDIVILSGDVHFGRVARAIIGNADFPHQIIEIISSPMAYLDHAESFWDLGHDDDPAAFPRRKYRHAVLGRAAIDYLEATEPKPAAAPFWLKTHPDGRLEAKPGTEPDPGKGWARLGGESADNFATVSFVRRSPGVVDMTIRSWLPRRGPPSKTTIPLDYERSFRLRRRRWEEAVDSAMY